MQRNRRWRSVALTFILLSTASAASAEPRTWSDDSGKFSITADLVVIQQGNVVLRTDDGRQLTVPVKKLSAADREFVEGLASPGKSPRRGGGKSNELMEVAKSFFNELRSEKREVAGEMLTSKAKEVLAAGKSPLASLPAPEEGDRALRVGRPKIDKETAEIPVQVKSADKLHKVKLHLRKEDDQWRIFAMSAMYPEGERLINLESELVPEGEGNSLEALVGKPFQFSGMTLDGKPLDLRRYQGKAIVVAFWIAQNRAEMANVFASYKKHFQEGFDVISVHLDDDLMTLTENVNRERPPWAVVADKYPGNPQPMGQKYQISQLPTLILVGRDGNVVSVDCTGKKLEEELAKILPAKPAPGEPASDKAAKAENADAPVR
jgi:hypothetical protein